MPARSPGRRAKIRRDRHHQVCLAAPRGGFFVRPAWGPSAVRSPQGRRQQVAKLTMTRARAGDRLATMHQVPLPCKPPRVRHAARTPSTVAGSFAGCADRCPRRPPALGAARARTGRACAAGAAHLRACRAHDVAHLDSRAAGRGDLRGIEPEAHGHGEPRLKRKKHLRQALRAMEPACSLVHIVDFGGDDDGAGARRGRGRQEQPG